MNTIQDPKEEFRRLLKASGWSQAEASRQLCMTPSALSQIVRHNSPVRPSTISLRLFKLLVWREKPSALQAVIMREDMPGLDRPEQELIRRLRLLPPKARHNLLRTISSLINASIKLAPPAKSRKRA